MLMLDICVDIVKILVKILMGYTAVMGILFLIPWKKYPVVSPKTRFAVLIPARNEENVISHIVESLQSQNYPKDLYDIIVIPNNCTDDTEGAALRAGVKVMHCTGPVATKGEVLHQILDCIMGSYDAYLVFDADNIVDSEFLSRMNDAVAAGAKVAKSRQYALNPYDNWVSGGYDLYFQSHTILHNRGRAPFNLSAKLVGTGFMVTDALLQEMGGWNTVTLTEDIEFASQCAMLGYKVYFVPDAITYDEQPLSFKVSMRQRWRWSAGVQSVANRYTSRLLSMRPTWLRWDLASHINMIYVQLLGLVPVLYGLFSSTFGGALKIVGLAVLGFAGSSVLMALFLCVTARRNPMKQWKAILLYPLFLISWYPLHIRALFNKPKTWKPIVHGVDSSREKVKETVK